MLKIFIKDWIIKKLCVKKFKNKNKKIIWQTCVKITKVTTLHELKYKKNMNLNVLNERDLINSLNEKKNAI
jgi:hypothetical protein